MLFEKPINKLKLIRERLYKNMEAIDSFKNVSAYFLLFILVKMLMGASLAVFHSKNAILAFTRISKKSLHAVVIRIKKLYAGFRTVITKARAVLWKKIKGMTDIARNSVSWLKRKNKGLLKRLKVHSSKEASAKSTDYAGEYIKEQIVPDFDENGSQKRVVEAVIANEENSKSISINKEDIIPVPSEDIAPVFQKEETPVIHHQPGSNIISEQEYTPVNKTACENPVVTITESSVQNMQNLEWRQSPQTARGKPFYFCTMTGKEYLLKILALHQSLEKFVGSFMLWICCTDEVSYSILSKTGLSNTIILTLENLEDAELLSVKSYRKANEYCWTLKAPLIKYVLDNFKVDDVVYCDGDLYFFSDPKELYEEWGNNDIFLCPQRDIGWVESLYGKYQAGLMGFKNTNNSLECLNYWRSKCIEWCYSSPDPQMERFGDQKYLDKLPFLFQGVKIIENLGVDAAPWNCIYNNNYNIFEKDNQIYIEKDKLMVFHFATIAIYNESEFDLWNFNYIPISKIILNKIYLPYLTSIRECANKLRTINAEFMSYVFNQNSPSEAKTYYRYPPLKFMIDVDNDTKFFCTIMSGEYLIKGLAFYNSLKMHAGKFHLWICCADEAARDILTGMKLKNVTLVHLADIEDDRIKQVKSSRKLNEFCWTLKAPLVQHILANYDVDSIIYCDADIFFFSSPQPVFESWKGHSIFICRQRDTYEFEKVHGSYQAGFIGFRNDRESLNVMAWWKEKFIYLCFDDPQPQLERWGDQKYLDSLPMQFSSIKLDNNKGINAAPWNIVFNNSFNVFAANGEVYIDNEKLIFYHFGSMLFYNENEFDLWKLRVLSFNHNIINEIYLPYLKAVRNVITEAMPYINTYFRMLFSDKSATPPVNYFNLADK
jgi:hypothetical protein